MVATDGVGVVYRSATEIQQLHTLPLARAILVSLSLSNLSSLSHAHARNFAASKLSEERGTSRLNNHST